MREQELHDYKKWIVLLLSFFFAIANAQEKVQMTLESSGTFSVPCELNGLKLRFTFDTGASHVSLSSVEADYMLKNGYLSKSDFLDKRTYSLANGKEEEDQVVNIKTLKIGNRTLHDVKACISTETKASLLLGQSALRKLGKYMVDGDVLILYPYTEEDSVKNAKLDLAAFTLNGKHTQTYDIGTYSGYYKNGLRDSVGTMTYNDGAKYDGQWKDDQYEGYGVYTSAKGDKYVGQYHVGEFDGKGKFTRSDGSSYDGEWKQGRCNGKLKAVFADGSSYDGDWVDGEMTGRATISYTTGNKYVGEVVKGKCNGSGKMTYANGDTYDGTWKDNQFDGSGIFQFKSGAHYEGGYIEGKKSGQGTYTWQNGDKYVGEWRDNMRNGQGTYYFADGDNISGLWQNDQPVEDAK